nr:MAG TPA: hypothetical protein [Caudoviricetes sp.]
MRPISLFAVSRYSFVVIFIINSSSFPQQLPPSQTCHSLY